MPKQDIGIIGLAVMGQNLALNMESKGYSVAVYNRTGSRTEEFISERTQGKNIKATYSLKELVDSLSHPRRIMLMVKAGSPVDENIEALLERNVDVLCVEPGLVGELKNALERAKSKSMGDSGMGNNGQEQQPSYEQPGFGQPAAETAPGGEDINPSSSFSWL